MEITLPKVEYKEKSVLRNLMELYLHDFSEYESLDVGEQGLYEYAWIDHYFTEPGRHAFFIRVDGCLAGFVLVRVGWFGFVENFHQIAEFFIMRKYRRKGVGSAVAVTVFDLFPGQWEVWEIDKNLPAQAFWRKVIGDYTSGQYEELRRPEEWEGPIQTFSTPGWVPPPCDLDEDDTQEDEIDQQEDI